MSATEVDQPRSAASNISGANLCHQRGIALRQQESKTQSEAVLKDTAVWSTAVYQPQSARQEHIRRSCVSSARYSCISKKKKKSISGRHSRVDQGGVYQSRKLYINSNHERKRKHFWSTQPCRPGRCLNRKLQNKSISGAAVYHQRGIAVYQQQSKFQANALRDGTVMSTGAVHQPREFFLNSSQNWNESTSGRHSRVALGGVSTTINKVKSSLVQLYITSAV